MFDRFKFNRKQEEKTIECPLCQEKNLEDAEICSQPVALNTMSAEGDVHQPLTKNVGAFGPIAEISKNGVNDDRRANVRTK